MIAYINKCGLFCYRYDDACSGCLYWCTTALNMLIHKNLIAKDTQQRFWAFIEHVRDTVGDVYCIPNDQGSFLDVHGHVVTLSSLGCLCYHVRVVEVALSL